MISQPLRRRFLASLLLAILLSVAHAANATDATEADVLAADEKRVQAMIANDVPSVAALLSDTLSYGHSDGRVQTKAQLLAALSGSSTRYRSFRYQNREVRPLGTARAVTGVAKLQVMADGVPLEFTVRFLAVYVDENGAWRLAAYQSAQILPPKP